MKLKKLITACAAIAVSSAGLAICTEAAVSADTEWYLYIGGQEYIATQTLEGNGWTWNHETTTLTLNGYNSTAIYFDNFTTVSETEYTCPVFNVEVIGENSISNTNDNQPSYGGSIYDALSINNATLNIYGTDKETDKLNITNKHIHSDQAISAYSHNTSDWVLPETSSVTISDLSIDINGSEYGISTFTLDISNCDITTNNILDTAMQLGTINAENLNFTVENNEDTVNHPIIVLSIGMLDLEYEAVLNNCAFDIDCVPKYSIYDTNRVYSLLSAGSGVTVTSTDCTYNAVYEYTSNESHELYVVPFSASNATFSNDTFDIDVINNEETDNLLETHIFSGYNNGTLSFNNCEINANVHHTNDTVYLVNAIDTNTMLESCLVNYNVSGDNTDVYAFSFIQQDYEGSRIIQTRNGTFTINIGTGFNNAYIIKGDLYGGYNNQWNVNFGDDSDTVDDTYAIFGNTVSAYSTMNDKVNCTFGNSVAKGDVLIVDIIDFDDCDITVNAVNTDAEIGGFTATNAGIRTSKFNIPYPIDYFMFDAGSTEYSGFMFTGCDIICEYEKYLFSSDDNITIIDSVVNANGNNASGFVATNQSNPAYIESVLQIENSVIDIKTVGFGIDVPYVTFDDSRVNIKSAYIYNVEKVSLNYTDTDLWVAENEDGILGTLDKATISKTGKLIKIQPTICIEVKNVFATDEFADFDIETSFMADDTAQMPHASAYVYIRSYKESSNNWVLFSYRTGNTLSPNYNIDLNLDENGTISPYNVYFTEYNAGNPSTTFSIGYSIDDTASFEEYLIYTIAKYFDKNIDSDGLLDIITMGTVYEANGTAKEIGKLDVNIAMRGDANLDNVIDTKDAALMAKYASEKAISGDTPPVMSAINDYLAKLVSDINNDTAIDTKDAANAAMFASTKSNYPADISDMDKYIGIWKEIGVIS